MVGCVDEVVISPKSEATSNGQEDFKKNYVLGQSEQTLYLNLFFQVNSDQNPGYLL